MPSPFGYVGLSDVVDVIATSILIYYVLLLIRGTRAVQILTGILVLLALLGIATLFHLYLLGTILRLLVVGAAVTIPIVFQPELRRALEQIGRGGLFRMERERGESGRNRPEDRTVAILGRTAFLLGRNRRGALIVLEQQSGLKDYCESGTSLHADVSEELAGVDLRFKFAPARRRSRYPRGSHRSCRLHPAVIGTSAFDHSPRYAPSCCAGGERGDRRRRARRFGTDGSDYDRARRAALAADRRRATFDKNAAGGDETTASTAGHGLARASAVATATAAGRGDIAGFVKESLDWRLSAKTSR